MAEPCVVCRHRTPDRPAVCDPCRERVADQLADLPRQLAAAVLRIVPAVTPGGERVTNTPVEAPLPVRVDALSVTGPGSEYPNPAAHLLIRRWQTTQTVTVTTADGPVERTIVDWHQELVRDVDGNPVHVPDDDQIGNIPPIEWLDMWVRTWRKHFGHHVPARTRYTPSPTVADRRAATAARRTRRIGYATQPATMGATAYLLAAERMIQQGRINRVLGIGPAQQPADRPLDPLADEWETRFGEPTRAEAPTADVAYLLTWLDTACDEDIGVADLAAELRTLTAELTRILGDTPDQQWLGRCPVELTVTTPGDGDEPAHTSTRICGAGLWQDPHASQIRCARCHTTWGPARIDHLKLAAGIRHRWPVDRRRRYHHHEVTDLTESPPWRCPTCTTVVDLTWVDVTAPTDTRRWYKPTATTCPNGCPEARRLL